MRVVNLAISLLVAYGVTACAIAIPGKSDSSNAGNTSSTSNPGVVNPVITSFTANPSALRIGQTLALTAEAVSSSGKTLAFTWFATGGTLSSTSGKVVSWTAPSSPSSYTIQLMVTDGAGGQAAGNLNILVSSSGDVTVGSPTIAQASPPPAGGGTPHWSKICGISSLNDFCFINSNQGWVVGDKGVISSSTDGGCSWVSKTITTQNLNSVCFVTSNNGWVAGDNGVLFLTTDSGSTWKLIDWAGAGKEEVTAIRFIDLANGLMITTGGFFKTIDGGNSWAKIADLNQPKGNIFCFPNGKAFICENWPFTTDYLKYEQGALSKISGLQYYPIISMSFPDPNNSQVAWACTQGTGLFSNFGDLYRSSDGGSTWVAHPRLNIGTQFITNYTPLAIGFSSINDGLLVTDNQMYFTTDGGVTWGLQSDMRSVFNYGLITKLSVFDLSHALARINRVDGFCNVVDRSLYRFSP